MLLSVSEWLRYQCDKLHRTAVATEAANLRYAMKSCCVPTWTGSADEGLRQLDLRILIPPTVEDGQLADGGGNLRVARDRQLRGGCFALRGVVVFDADFDQLVALEGALRLFDDRGTYAGAADADDRFEGVGQALEVLALLRGERHGGAW